MTDKLQVQRTALGRYKSYPSYKDSGVEWLGEIPAHWQFMPLKHLCKRSGLYGANEPAEAYIEEGVRFLRTTDISDKGGLVRDGVYLSFETVSDYILQTGDLLFSRSGTIGRSFLYDQVRHGPCAYAGYLVRFVPGPEFFPLFGFYFTKSLQFEHWATTSVISSTIGNVNAQKYANMPCPKPPLAEQKAISAFLDRETAKIDALIQKKERLIELLQEKRTALITQAVTKGLDPSVFMKDSGVEWIERIPGSWKVYPLFTVAREKEKRNIGNQVQNVLSLSYGKIINKDVDDNFGLLPESFETYQIVNEGNIILRLTDLQNDKRSLRVGLVRNQGIITSAYICLDFFRDIDPPYAFYLLYAYDITKVFYSLGGGVRQTMKFEDLKWLPILVPSAAQQHAIASYLDRETAKIDSLVAKIHEAIDRLKEYRNTLISAAVTGKIDVREA